MYQKEDELEIDLGKLLHYYLEHWVSLLISGVGCALVALLITMFLITPQYRASVTVYVNNTKSTQSIEAITGTNLSAVQQLVNTYVNIIKSNTVLKDVIEKGRLEYTPAQIRDMMTASQIADTEMFTVTISHPNPEMAVKIADSIAYVAPKRISSFVKGSSTEIIDYAEMPTAPYTPSYPKNIVLGGLLGGIVMGAILTFRFLFDMRIKTDEDIVAYLKIPVLGVIPEKDAGEKRKSNRYEMAASAQGGHR